MNPRTLNRALVIKPSWFGLIVDGKKTWELRSRRTNIRGSIGLVESGSGAVGGTAILDDCIPLTADMLSKNLEKHCVPIGQLGDYGTQLYAWVLSGARRLKKPIPYKHPRGAIIWVKLK